MKKVYMIVVYQSGLHHDPSSVRYVTEHMDDDFWAALAPFQSRGNFWAVEEWDLDKPQVWNGGQKLNGIEIATCEDLRSFKESLLMMK